MNNLDKRKIIIIAVVVVLVLIIIGVWWYYSRKPASERPGIISALFPFAKEVQVVPGTGGLKLKPGEEAQVGKEQKITEKTEGGRKLIRLTDKAISGAGLASTTVRYVERETGHIYEIGFDAQNRQRLSNTTILKTFESFWSPKADRAIIRYFEDQTAGQGPYLNAKTFSLNLNNPNSTSSTVFFPKGILGMAVSPTEEKAFYLFSLNETARGAVSGFENKAPKEIFNNPFGEFNVFWPKSDLIVLLTKPSFDVKGYLYSLNPSSGAFSKIMGDINGLTALVSPDFSKVIYGQSMASSLVTKVFLPKDNSSADLEFTTFPEKCVFSKANKNIVYCAVPDNLPRAEYPDDWYQGIIFFKDSMWQKDFSTGKTTIIMNNINADIINPLLTKDDGYLIFTDKDDNTLWSLKLK